MAQLDEIISLREFAARLSKKERQAKRLFGIHAGLKVKTTGVRELSVNWTQWQRILNSPKGHLKLVR